MELRVNLKIFMFAIIFYFTKQIEIYALLMFFAVLHELGHLVAGILLGSKVKSISIMPLGLSIGFGVDTHDYNKKIGRGNFLNIKKIIIAFAGPMVNFFIVILFLIFPFQFFSIEMEYIIYANLLIGIFNLIPIYPLDGGRILKGMLQIYKGVEKSMIIINITSNACVIVLTAVSSVAILYYHNIAILFIIVYLWYITLMENKKFQSKMKIYEAIDTYRQMKKEEVNDLNGKYFPKRLEISK